LVGNIKQVFIIAASIICLANQGKAKRKPPGVSPSLQISLIFMELLFAQMRLMQRMLEELDD